MLLKQSLSLQLTLTKFLRSMDQFLKYFIMLCYYKICYINGLLEIFFDFIDILINLHQFFNWIVFMFLKPSRHQRHLELGGYFSKRLFEIIHRFFAFELSAFPAFVGVQLDIISVALFSIQGLRYIFNVTEIHLKILI